MVVSAIEKEKIRTRQGVLEAQRLGSVFFFLFDVSLFMGEWKCFMCLVCSVIIPYVLEHHIESGDLQGHRLILHYIVLAKIFMWTFL